MALTTNKHSWQYMAFNVDNADLKLGPQLDQQVPFARLVKSSAPELTM